MTYDELKTSISLILESELINKNGLVLEYHLSEVRFNDIYLEFMSDIKQDPIEKLDMFEISIDGLTVKCVKNVKKSV